MMHPLPAEIEDADQTPDLSPPVQAAALAAVTVGALLFILLVRAF